MVGRFLATVALPILAITFTFSADTSVVHIDLDKVPAESAKIDGREIQVEGIVLMSEDSREVVSSLDVSTHTCVALLVTEDEFLAFRRFHKKKAVVTGVFDKAGCGGLRVCHDSCGPYAVWHPRISESRENSP